MAVVHVFDFLDAGFAGLLSFLLIPRLGPFPPMPACEGPIPGSRNLGLCFAAIRGQISVNRAQQGSPRSGKAVAFEAGVPEIRLVRLALPGFGGWYGVQAWVPLHCSGSIALISCGWLTQSRFPLRLL